MPCNSSVVYVLKLPAKQVFSLRQFYHRLPQNSLQFLEHMLVLVVSKQVSNTVSIAQCGIDAHVYGAFNLCYGIGSGCTYTMTMLNCFYLKLNLDSNSGSSHRWTGKLISIGRRSVLALTSFKDIRPRTKGVDGHLLIGSRTHSPRLCLIIWLYR